MIDVSDEDGFVEEHIKLEQELQDATKFKPRAELSTIETKLMAHIGSLDVFCPHCQMPQHSLSARTKTCINCGKSFTIFTKHKNYIYNKERMKKNAHTIMRLSSIVLNGRDIASF